MIDSATVPFDWGFEEPLAVVVEPAEETSVGLHRSINVSATRWMVYDTESAAVEATRLRSAKPAKAAATNRARARPTFGPAARPTKPSS